MLDPKWRELLENNLVLLEDDDDAGDADSGDDADSDGGDDEDSDDDVPDMDIGTKEDIRIIENTLDLLIKINSHLMTTYDSEFYDINTVVYKVRYNFILFVNNYESYEDKDKSKIIKSLKGAITIIIKEILSKLG